MAETRPLYFNPIRLASNQDCAPVSITIEVPRLPILCNSRGATTIQGLLEKFLVRVHFRKTLQSPQGAGTLLPSLYLALALCLPNRESVPSFYLSFSRPFFGAVRSFRPIAFLSPHRRRAPSTPVV